MKLDQKLYDNYWENGWVVVENVFAHDEVDKIAKLAVELAEKDLASKSGGSVDISSNGTNIAPRKLFKPFLIHRDFREFVLNDRLKGIISDLIGEQALLATDQIFMKPPRIWFR